MKKFNTSIHKSLRSFEAVSGQITSDEKVRYNGKTTNDGVETEN